MGKKMGAIAMEVKAMSEADNSGKVLCLAKIREWNGCHCNGGQDNVSG